MMVAPAYFESIRRRSAARWDQLESDPDLAAPWHQLFKQVQSPRHVLSELLQNADDAGATEATVFLDDTDFVFSHSGEDFTEDHFASLCRFGYSNKRALHTIGFRGIGFKSVFSLGPTVILRTPSLSVAFDSRRFTEPRWVQAPLPQRRVTEVRVALADEHRRLELERNLNEWLASPLSLLFFRNVRRLRIGGKDIHWSNLGPGPVANSQWLTLNNNAEATHLLVRSPAAPFPSAALAEIRQERMLRADQETDFPPCSIEIVLGAPGTLYVVLPTGVRTALPFACNGPFIQDPARLKIKDPETSPTNRWLLARAGALAAATMLKWVGDSTASTVERSKAYGLLPDLAAQHSSLEEACASLVETSFRKSIEGKPILLTEHGRLKGANDAVRFPAVLRDIWPKVDLSSLFDEEARPLFSTHVSNADCHKLLTWGVLDEIDESDVIDVLRTEHLPRPKRWRQLLRLWAYVAPEVTRSRYYRSETDLKIIPVQGHDVLYALSELVRLGEKRLLQSDADWEFLASYLVVLDPNWLRYLAEQRRLAEEPGSTETSEDVSAAYAVLDALDLQEASDASKVLDQAAAKFFAQDSLRIGACVQLAQIAAKLNAAAGPNFRFVTRDGCLRSTADDVLASPDSALEMFVSHSWAGAHFLHPQYERAPTSCSREEWRRWIASGRAGLLGFVPLSPARSKVWGRQTIQDELRRRGVATPPTYHFATSHFEIDDWDFAEEHWEHWVALANDDSKLWTLLTEQIFAQPEAYWSKAKAARVSQVATTGRARQIVYDPVTPRWLLRLRELPCLPDTRGAPRKPTELLCRTPTTEAVIDVEPFVHGLLDRESTRPLLKLLGVRDTPTGPDRLLEYLRAFASSSEAPAHEVEKWYRRLDQMIDACSTADAATIRDAFRNERIILTEDGSWTTASGAFLMPDDGDAPGLALIRAAVRDLSLWRKVGVADQPTADLAIAWLSQLPSGSVLSAEDARRVRTLLPRHALRIWYECGHWLNLAGEWTPIASLSYALTMQSLVSWSHLHDWVKKSTADLQRLPVELTEAPALKSIPLLADRINEKFEHPPILFHQPQEREWLVQLGNLLARTQWDDEAEQNRIRALGRDLAKTYWQVVPTLEILPYIDGTPAGTARRVEALWQDGFVYVLDRPAARLARSVAHELGRVFRRAEIADAIKVCFERPSRFVAEYMEENFKLGPEEPILASDHGKRTITDEPASSPSARTERAITDAGAMNGSATADQEVITALRESADDQPRQGHDDREAHKSTRERSRPRVPDPSIMERFAQSEGFHLTADGGYFRTDGSWITKVTSDVFPWQRSTAQGEITRRYWPKNHCIDREPLQIEAEVWSLIDKFPDEYALILADPEGKPTELRGSRLRVMRGQGALALYPASYRLKVDHDRKQ